MDGFHVFMLIVIAFLIIATTSCDKTDKNLEKVSQGHMSKTFYQGHSYILWGINTGGGCVHDPDCPCKKEDK